MIVKRGRYRLVFVFSMLGLALKFPSIRPIKVFHSAIKTILAGEFSTLWKMIKTPPNRSDISGYQDWLFGGIASNWSEFVFFWKTRHPFLQPTYFSFFGFFNIQKLGDICTIQEKNFDAWLGRLAEDPIFESLFEDPHHFSNPENFCFDKGKFRIVDYGNKKTHGGIIECGNKIMVTFSKPAQ